MATPTATYPGVGYTTVGFDHNYFNKVNVTATGTFGSDTTSGQMPDVIIPFMTQGVILTNHTVAQTTSPTFTSPTTVVEVSFNGTQTHMELGSDADNVSFQFNNRVISCIWFRVQSGSTGPIVVSVQAWAAR
jgi:hypothetical protein